MLVEAEYVRGSTTPAKVTDGIAADLTKYPEEAHILFVVLDPEGLVPDDNVQEGRGGEGQVHRSNCPVRVG